MYKKEKKILLAGHQKSRTWLFSGENLEDMFDVASSYAEWILKSDKTIGNLLVVREKSLKLIHVEKIHSFLSLTSNSSNQKVLIISHSEIITLGASNALLKVLEEGSQLATIIIITKNLHQILSTIRSRCFHLYFPPLKDLEKGKALTTQYKNLLQTALAEKTKSSLPEKLTEVSLRTLLCFTFNRILKFHHKVLEEEVFSGEKALINELGQSRIFWQYRWLQISKALSTPQDLYIEKNCLMRVALIPEEI